MTARRVRPHTESATPMQAPILTLTMNPALDLSTHTEQVEPEHKLRCGPVRSDPGGGGVNVMRAIRNLGGDAAAVFPVGGATGERFRASAEASGVSGRVVPIAGNTRENFTVDETSTGAQYRFVLPGPHLTTAEWRACVAAVWKDLPRGGYLVASGSLPPGVPEDFYAMLVRAAAAQDVRVVVDASGPPLEAALTAGVFLIKPSRDELAQLVGAGSELSVSEQFDAARAIVDDGRAKMVAVTMGSGGAILVWAEGALRLPAPSVRVVSAVGAGDAFLAGLVLRLAQGSTMEQAFRTAVAAGSASASMPATELCRGEDVRRLESELPTAAPLPRSTTTTLSSR